MPISHIYPFAQWTNGFTFQAPLPTCERWRAKVRTNNFRQNKLQVCT
jgi:hypothetical protein